MKRLFKIQTILMFLLLISTAAVADSLVSDPVTEHVGASFEIWQAAKNLTDVQVVATGTLIVAKNMEANGSIKYNLDSLPTGTFRCYVRAYQSAYVYGPDNTPGGSSVYSVFVPFDFTKRGSASGPIKGLRLAPQ